MNKGIQKATGEIIGLINADDYYADNAVAEVVNAYEKYGDEALYHGLMQIIDSNEMKIGILNPVPESKFFMLIGCSIAHPTTFVPRALYEKFGGYNETLKLSSDYDFLLRLVNHSVRPIFLNQIIAFFREGGASSALFPTAVEAHKARVNNGVNYFISLLFLIRVFIMFVTKEILIKLKLHKVITWYQNNITQSHRRINE